MHRVKVSRRQFALLLEGEERSLVPEEIQDALVSALADLLLEALGTEGDEETNGSRGDAGEHEDYA